MLDWISAVDFIKPFSGCNFQQFIKISSTSLNELTLSMHLSHQSKTNRVWCNAYFQNPFCQILCKTQSPFVERKCDLLLWVCSAHVDPCSVANFRKEERQGAKPVYATLPESLFSSFSAYTFRRIFQRRFSCRLIPELEDTPGYSNYIEPEEKLWLNSQAFSCLRFSIRPSHLLFIQARWNAKSFQRVEQVELDYS